MQGPRHPSRDTSSHLTMAAESTCFHGPFSGFSGGCLWVRDIHGGSSLQHAPHSRGNRRDCVKSGLKRVALGMPPSRRVDRTGVGPRGAVPHIHGKTFHSAGSSLGTYLGINTRLVFRREYQSPYPLKSNPLVHISYSCSQAWKREPGGGKVKGRTMLSRVT